jgi:hypothetical protein
LNENGFWKIGPGKSAALWVIGLKLRYHALERR